MLWSLFSVLGRKSQTPRSFKLPFPIMVSVLTETDRAMSGILSPFTIILSLGEQYDIDFTFSNETEDAK
jgi:hypothetical protein